MSRYAKVGVQMWSDAKFRNLSRPKPSGRELWVYLITNPAKTALPGVLHIGEASLAEGLEWPLSAIRRHWKEIEMQGMAEADWRARLIWIRNMPKWDPPNAPNVAKAWGRVLAQMPECELRSKIAASVDAFLDAINKGFLDAFREGFRNAIPYTASASASASASTSRFRGPSPMPSPGTAPAGAPGEGGANGTVDPDPWPAIRDALMPQASLESRRLLACIRSQGIVGGVLQLRSSNPHAVELVDHPEVRAAIREAQPGIAWEARATPLDEAEP